MKKMFAASLAVALGIGGVVGLGAASASAHVPSISASCSGVVLTATDYDGNKQNDWTATVGGVTTSGHFGSSLSKTIAVAQGGATTSWSATIQAFDGSYKDSEHGSVGPCGTVLKDASAAIVVTAPTCSADGSAAWGATVNVVTPLPTLSEAVGNDTSPTITAVDLHQFANGSTTETLPYTILGKIATQSTNSDAPCYQAPPPPGGVACTVTGPAYAESGDLFAVKTAGGYQFTSAGNAKPVDLGFPASGNLQGFTSLTYADKNVVGNGIFFRFVLDLSADGGSAYNSFSVAGSNTVDQSSVANVGSKPTLLGKTVAQVAALYPHNQIKAIFWETGSSYPAGDGAILTGYSGACGNASFVTGVTPPTPPTSANGGDIPLNPLYPASALLIAGGLVFAFRKRLAAKF